MNDRNKRVIRMKVAVAVFLLLWPEVLIIAYALGLLK